MYVIKRDGRTELVSFDKISRRIVTLADGLVGVDAMIISQKVVAGVFPGVTTSQLDELAAETAAACMTQHPEFGKLASRISVSNMQKNTPRTFSDVIVILKNHVHPKTGLAAPLVSQLVYNIVMENTDLINSKIVHERDFEFDYFGFKTLEKSYLLRKDGVVLERPQYLFMRVALGIHGNDLESAFETYSLMVKIFIQQRRTNEVIAF